METKTMLTTAERTPLESHRDAQTPPTRLQPTRPNLFSVPHASLASAARRLVFYAALIAVWELLARSGIWPSYLFPGPGDTLNALTTGFSSGTYLQGMLVSLKN